jgi:hypothetical protein
MDNDTDWIFVENEDELVDEFKATSICEKSDDDEDCDIKNESSYASALLKNGLENHHQQHSVLSIVQKKEKANVKEEDKQDLATLYTEPKPGSQYRNPRDKAGQNKVHRRRRKSSSPPKNIGNSLKTGCSFCNTKFVNRAERRRTLRQQRSAVNWKDYDY